MGHACGRIFDAASCCLPRLGYPWAVAADILAGGESMKGLLCDLLDLSTEARAAAAAGCSLGNTHFAEPLCRATAELRLFCAVAC